MQPYHENENFLWPISENRKPTKSHHRISLNRSRLSNSPTKQSQQICTNKPNNICWKKLILTKFDQMLFFFFFGIIFLWVCRKGWKLLLCLDLDLDLDFLIFILISFSWFGSYGWMGFDKLKIEEEELSLSCINWVWVIEFELDKLGLSFNWRGGAQFINGGTGFEFQLKRRSSVHQWSNQTHPTNPIF